MAIKIYTKTGDKGKTSLIGGTRVPKHHIRIETYGTVDELNSWIGLVRDQEINSAYKTILLEVQDRLFTIGSLLAADPAKNKMKLPQLNESDVILLENTIDKMNECLPEMRSFVLPGGHPVVSYCHIARCVCRRAERFITQLSESTPIPDLTLKYLNRLSDYLFVLARLLSLDLKVVETPWKPRM